MSLRLLAINKQRLYLHCRWEIWSLRAVPQKVASRLNVPFFWDLNKSPSSALQKWIRNYLLTRPIISVNNILHCQALTLPSIEKRHKKFVAKEHNLVKNNEQTCRIDSWNVRKRYGGFAEERDSKKTITVLSPGCRMGRLSDYLLWLHSHRMRLWTLDSELMRSAFCHRLSMKTKRLGKLLMREIC